jgi:hypothetical protein
MNTTKRMTLLAISAALVLAACSGNNDNNENNPNNTAANNTTPNNATTANNTAVNNTAANNTAANNTAANNTAANNTTTTEDPAVDPADGVSITVGEAQSYTISGLNPDQAYRITLVVEGNVTVAAGAGTFIDNDDNGAADAGPSENVALITSVNGTAQDGAKTVPAGSDDPAAPSGIFPSDAGEITIEVTGQGLGTVYPVIYHNGGESTFLEIDANGAPTETHIVGGGLTVGYEYAFATEGPDAFTRVDRKGMPAVATALIASKDDYNAADPADDALATFVPEILTALDAIHTALDDDLATANLTPCTVVGDGTGSCAAVGAPLIVPDTLKIDTTAAAGFPNGRRLADPSMDITLAVVLLEIADGTHSPTDLVGALNPTENDVEFKTDFPYLADPQ